MDFDTLFENAVTYIVNPLIALVFVTGFVVFLFGVVRYFMQAESDEGRRTGAQHMLWGVIGMFIMVAVFAIIQVIKNTFGIV
jgi:uncharacterized membrane-anchored protein